MAPRQLFVGPWTLRVLALSLAAQGEACIPPEVSADPDAQAHAGHDAQPDVSDEQCPTVFLNDNDCYQCCANNHDAGSTLYWNTFSDCICGSGGVCQAACAQTDCSNAEDAAAPEAGDPCSKCENMALGGQCGTQLRDTCFPVSDCKAFYDCYDNCN